MEQRRNLRRVQGLAALALALCSCATQSPHPTEERRAPASNARVSSDAPAQLGIEALSALERIARDPKEAPARRARAVSSMGQLGQVAAEDRLKALLADAGLEVQYRASAATALGPRAGAQSVKSLAPFLEDADPAIRGTVARALGSAGTAEARKSLEERLQKEQDPAVREALQQSLTRLEP